MTTLDVDVRAQLGTFALDARFRTDGIGITALFGRSGTGKTSLVNMLAGLWRPREGRIVVAGETLFDSARGIDVPPERRRIGYVFQEGRLFPHRTVRGNLLYGARRLAAAERSRLFDEIVALLALEPLLARRPRALSGGEQRRVAIGRALLSAPRLVLMDEPLTGLDAPRKAEILPYIERLHDEHRVPIVYVTHAMEEIVRLADTLVLIADGRVAASGKVAELLGRRDLMPLTGRYEAGAVIEARVTGQDGRHRLTHLSFAGGSLRVPSIPVPVGRALRLQLRARDVSLALERPTGISVLNMLPGRVIEIGDGDDSQVDVLVDVGVPIWARVTHLSVQDLDLVPGRQVHALIKAVAIDRRSFGAPGSETPSSP